jgi:serine/threonine protein kinase/serine/threonine protein phosphatase PrpC
MNDIDIGYTSLAGTKPINEDFAGAMLPGKDDKDMGVIMALADGVSMGGMGKEAAQTTVTSLVRDYFCTPPTWDTSVALDRIIAAQNAWLVALNKRRPELGFTTLTALVLRGQTYTLAHVGDTRCYLLRDGQLTQLTHDHIVNHTDFKHQLLRSVGSEDRLAVDYSQGEVMLGDCFILLSDGVYGFLSDSRIKAIFKDIEQQTGTSWQSLSETLAENLVDAALKSGSNDNASALVAHVKGLSAATLEDATLAALNLPIPSLLKVGDKLDGFEVLAPVADSGINVIYQVKESATGKLYALKTLHPSRTKDKEERTMLVHEAWLTQQLQATRAADSLVHLKAEDAATAPRSKYYIVYDWHNGETLQQQLDRGAPFDVAHALNAATQITKALSHLHRQNVIHRDIKPANLHQGADGVLRLLDLGVALSGKEPASMRDLHAGTPSYINPEQWGMHYIANYKNSSKAGNNDADDSKEAPDAQSDLFALGVTLYQLLTGKLPYGEILPGQSGRYYRDPLAPSRHRPEIPKWLDNIVLKAIARDKNQRFETAEELLLALDRGASRPLSAPLATPLIQRDPTAVWKIGLGVSVLFNLLLVYWLLFLPK